MESKRKISGNNFFSGNVRPRKSCALVRGEKSEKCNWSTYVLAAATEAVKSKTFEKNIDWRRKAPHATFGQEKWPQGSSRASGGARKSVLPRTRESSQPAVQNVEARESFGANFAA